MAFPATLSNLAANKANETLQVTDHPAHHNALANAVNAIETVIKRDLFENPVWHGADPTGVLDSTTAWRDCYDTGRPIYFEGTHRLTAQWTETANGGATTPLFLFGAGPKSVMVQDGDVRLINLGEALGTSTAVTVAAAPGATTLTVASTSGIAAGDWVQLRSNEVAPGATTTSVVGELPRVLSVDSATALTLDGPIEEDYLLADSPIVQRAPMIDGCLLRDFVIENANPGTYANQLEVIRLNQVANARVENVHFRYLDNPGIKIATCVDGTVDRCRWLDSTDDTVNNRFGYGVLAYNATRNLTVTNCYMNGGRHLFTTGAAASTPVPKHITVAHCHAANVTSTAFDTHEEGRWITFDNCTATNCMSNAFATRSPDTTFINPIAVRTERAIVVATGADRCNIVGGDLEGVSELELTTAYGIHVQGADCSILGTQINNTGDQGIEVTGNRCHISRVEIRNPGQSGANDTCIRLNGGDGHYVDGYFENATNGLQATSTVTNLSLGKISHNGSVTNPANLNASATYRVVYDLPGVQTLATDAAFSLTPATSPRQTIHTGTLTANRAVTLNTTGAARGMKYEIARSGGGAFNLNVGTGPLKALATGQWCEVTYDGSAWVLTKFGSL